MKLRPIFLPVLLAGGVIWFLLWRGFTVATVWLVEGGLARILYRYDLWWDTVRLPILLGVGVLILFYFVISILVWAWDVTQRRHYE